MYHHMLILIIGVLIAIGACIIIMCKYYYESTDYDDCMHCHCYYICMYDDGCIIAIGVYITIHVCIAIIIYACIMMAVFIYIGVCITICILHA